MDLVTPACVINPLVPLGVHLKFTFPLARASLPTMLHVLPHSLKVFWVLHPLASQFNARIANNLVMFEPSALILVLSLACMLRPFQTLTGIWTPVPPIT